MNVAIVGVGRIGGGLARRFAAAGHDVTLSFSRDEQRLAQLATELPGNSRAASPAEVAAWADVIVLSVPWAVIPDALAAVGPLDGKVVIDTTNQFGPDGLEELPPSTTAARFNARRMPGARVVKAFNGLTAEFQRTQAHRAGPPVVIFLSGDDEHAKHIVEGLIRGAGFAPCDLGGLDDATPMEAPRRNGAVYGEEYWPAEAEEARRLLAAGAALPPPPGHS